MSVAAIKDFPNFRVGLIDPSEKLESLLLPYPSDAAAIAQRCLRQGLLNRWTVQLDLGCTTGGVERVVSVHNST